MSTQKAVLVIVVLVLLAALVGAWAYPRLPERVASHWNAAGQVDDTMSRFWGVALMPMISVGMLLLFLIIPRIDPLKENIVSFRREFNLLMVLLVAFLLYLQALTLAWNLGIAFSMNAALPPAMGVLFLYIGFLLRRAKRNWFIGIRTPWTLSSETVWDETHRMGSVLFLGAGVLALLGAFFGEQAIWFIIVPVLAASLFLVVYSYILFQRERDG